MSVLLATMMSLPLMGSACPNVGSRFGINFHAPSGSDMINAINEAEALGLGWIRVDFDWLFIEFARGLYAWQRHDAIVAAAEARGLLVLATVAYTPQWATSGAERVGPPDDPQDWYNFVYQAVRRYDGRQGKGYIGYWGLWNEPNLTGFWGGTRQQYIDEILKNGADAVRAANPDAKVLGPTLSHMSGSGRDWFYWLRDCIDEAGDRIDILTHNTYGTPYTRVRDRLEASTLFGSNPGGWGTVSPSLKEVLQYTGWFATGKPVWISEVGWQSGSVGESTQAQYYTELLNAWLTGDPSGVGLTRYSFTSCTTLRLSRTCRGEFWGRTRRFLAKRLSTHTKTSSPRIRHLLRCLVLRSVPSRPILLPAYPVAQR
jgi:hypothetical protein